MPLIKFNEKNKAVFSKKESVPNVYQTGIVATDAVLATTITGSVTYETANIEFLGSSESRDEFSYYKDTYGEFAIETPVQILNTLNTSLNVDTLPLTPLYQACSGNVAVNGTTGEVTITNSISENSNISIDFAKTSADDAVYEKLFRFYGVRGTVDLSMDVGDIPRLKFAFKGNSLLPIQAAILAPDFGAQSTSISGIIRQSTIQEAKITPYGENFNAQSVITGTPTITRSGNVATVTLASHGLTTGRMVNISGATGAVDAYYYNGDFMVTVLTSSTFTYVMNGTPSGSAAGTLVAKKDGYAKTFCFDKLQGPNFFGREFTRYLTGCEEGFDRKAVSSDVTVSVLETHVPSFAVSSITRSTTTATLTTSAAHGLSAGNSITVEGATDPLYNGTFLIETAPTTTTLTYIMGGTPSASAVASFVGSLRVTNNTTTTFDPDSNVTKFFAVKLKFGTKVGQFVTILWDKLQLSTVKDGKVATSEGRDITFRNTGKATIVLG